MNAISETSRARINGALLSRYQGKPVCLLGNVSELDNSGKSFKLKASDGQIVTVQMQEPLRELLEGVVEVQGIVTQYSTVLCKQYIMFPKESAENFDMSLYNEAVQMMSLHPSHYIVS